jgi:hypothetical protein
LYDQEKYGIMSQVLVSYLFKTMMYVQRIAYF